MLTNELVMTVQLWPHKENAPSLSPGKGRSEWPSSSLASVTLSCECHGQPSVAGVLSASASDTHWDLGLGVAADH